MILKALLEFGGITFRLATRNVHGLTFLKDQVTSDDLPLVLVEECKSD